MNIIKGVVGSMNNNKNKLNSKKGWLFKPILNAT